MGEAAKKLDPVVENLATRPIHTEGPRELVSPAVALLPRPALLRMFRAVPVIGLLLRWLGACVLRRWDVLFDLVANRALIIRRRHRLQLERLRQNPAEVEAFAAAHPDLARRFEQRGLLIARLRLTRLHAFENVDIEINRHCNYRCTYCPVATDPKPKAEMPWELYRQVIARVKEYGARSISLNHYSEPTLMPDLVERVSHAASQGLEIRLYTNASLLDEASIAQLARVPGLQVIVNLPSVDRETYRRRTGSKLFDRVVRNLELLHRFKVPVTLSINQPRGGEGTADIDARFARMFGTSVSWPTDSRAGRLEGGDFGRAVRHQGRLGGCMMVLRQLSISYRGEVFLCCQDYDQRHTLGSVVEHSIRDIVESERAVRLREMIFGWREAPASFICRRCEWTCALEAEETALRCGSEDKLSANMELDVHPTRRPLIALV